MATILQHFAVTKVVDREIGIEIEMEGENLPNSRPPQGWTAEADGSLRGNSCEMIFTRPEPRSSVEHRLNLLASTMKTFNTRLAHTDRCGVHVHVNVQELEIQQVFTFILLYLLCEEVLVKYCGETREGNLFCLRAKDAEDLLSMLRHCKQQGSLRLIAVDQYRYASINMAALSKYGTLEFRALKTPDDIMSIKDWVDILLAIKDYTLKIKDAREIVEGFSEMGYEAFVKRVFGLKLYRLIKCAKMESLLRNGARRIQDICYTKSEEWVPSKESSAREQWLGELLAAGPERPRAARPVPALARRLADRTALAQEWIAMGRVAEPPRSEIGTIWTADLDYEEEFDEYRLVQINNTSDPRIRSANDDPNLTDEDLLMGRYISEAVNINNRMVIRRTVSPVPVTPAAIEPTPEGIIAPGDTWNRGFEDMDWTSGEPEPTPTIAPGQARNSEGTVFTGFTPSFMPGVSRTPFSWASSNQVNIQSVRTDNGDLSADDPV